MHQNPALVDVLVRDRVGDLRRSAAAGPIFRRGERRRMSVEGPRRAAGWLLVDVGLRLAVPGAGTTRLAGRDHVVSEAGTRAA